MRLIVHLTPKASHNTIEGWAQDARGRKVLRVKVTAVPEEGKANEALIKLLSKTLHVSKSRITLVRGATSRVKEIEIEAGEALDFLRESQGAGVSFLSKSSL